MRGSYRTPLTFVAQSVMTRRAPGGVQFTPYVVVPSVMLLVISAPLLWPNPDRTTPGWTALS